MAKSTNLNIRIEPEVKASVEALYANFGITVTDAVNMFLHQSLLVGGLPFELKHPRYNAQTEAAMQQARDIMHGKVQAKQYSSAAALFEELLADAPEDADHA